jgi:hypothetical protein
MKQIKLLDCTLRDLEIRRYCRYLSPETISRLSISKLKHDNERAKKLTILTG